MYEPLLLALVGVYPGFVVGLLVHLVDSILCLDGAMGDITCNDDDNNDCGGLDVEQLECNLEYLSRWVRYLLSREFHMHFDRRGAVFTPPPPIEVNDQNLQQRQEQQEQPLEEQSEPQPPPQVADPPAEGQSQTPIDLKKRGRKKWTPTQLEYMQSPLDYAYLHKDVGFPLNSVCDRLLLQKGGVKNNKGSSILGKLLHYLEEDVIGKKERVAFMGIFDVPIAGGTAEHDVNSSENDVTEEREGELPFHNNGADRESTTKETTTQDGSNTLSLEDMEEMMLDDAKEGEVNSNDDGNNDTNQNNHVQGEDTDVPTLGITYHGDKPVSIEPWALCKHWDACAIGTMPGFPS
jgi:hypothetical protein